MVHACTILTQLIQNHSTSLAFLAPDLLAYYSRRRHYIHRPPHHLNRHDPWHYDVWHVWNSMLIFVHVYVAVVEIERWRNEMIRLVRADLLMMLLLYCYCYYCMPCSVLLYCCGGLRVVARRNMNAEVMILWFYNFLLYYCCIQLRRTTMPSLYHLQSVEDLFAYWQSSP